MAMHPGGSVGFGNRFGSATARPGRQGKTRYVSSAYAPRDPAVPCLENPRVDGSIPSQATR
jgi:hypothetical protein